MTLKIFIALFLLMGVLLYLNWGGTVGHPVRIDKIVVEKSKHAMSVYGSGNLLKVYRVSLGKGVGPKVCQGDQKTPEGSYKISAKNQGSGYHRALKISYPNSLDRERAHKAGCPPGGDIMIHGLRNGLGWMGIFHRVIDWTQGCIAVTNQEIEEIFKATSIGVDVEILP